MSNSERDTKFQGFAKALDEEIQNAILGMSVDEWTPTRSAKLRKDIIARRAYDFACHVVDSGSPHICHVPDMTAWPEEEEQ